MYTLLLPETSPGCGVGARGVASFIYGALRSAHPPGPKINGGYLEASETKGLVGEAETIHRILLARALTAAL